MSTIHPLIEGKISHVFAGDGGSRLNFFFHDRKGTVNYYLTGCGNSGASFLHVKIDQHSVEVLPRFLPMRIDDQQPGDPSLAAGERLATSLLNYVKTRLGPRPVRGAFTLGAFTGTVNGVLLIGLVVWIVRRLRSR